ncbi:nitroreductase [Ferrimonas senticii]|uniref:nitroreductase n=1 Tax=Ferrimonas senticii TaxID=394566 RepID=UPI000484AFB2|nr:nitroreductase [Ferrimonas senticii]
MSDQQTLLRLLSERRSVRGFLQQPVANALLQQIFSDAQLSPSNCNTQPWHTYVASGASCQRLRQGLVEQASSGVTPKAEFGYYSQFEGDARQRQVECAEVLYGSMGIERGDKVGRMGALLRNYQFFDAPHVAFICMDTRFDVVNAIDIGTYLQTLMLLLQANGISSCAQGALAYFPELVKQELDIPAEQGIIVGLSFGYEDPNHPTCAARTSRAAVQQSVSFKS